MFEVDQWMRIRIRIANMNPDPDRGEPNPYGTELGTQLMTLIYSASSEQKEVLQNLDTYF